MPVEEWQVSGMVKILIENFLMHIFVIILFIR